MAYVIITKDGVKAEVVQSSYEDVWQHRGWELEGEPHDGQQLSPFEEAEPQPGDGANAGGNEPVESAAEPGAAPSSGPPAAASGKPAGAGGRRSDGVRTPGESNQKPEVAPNEAV